MSYVYQHTAELNTTEQQPLPAHPSLLVMGWLWAMAVTSCFLRMTVLCFS